MGEQNRSLENPETWYGMKYSDDQAPFNCTQVQDNGQTKGGATMTPTRATKMTKNRLHLFLGSIWKCFQYNEEMQDHTKVW